MEEIYGMGKYETYSPFLPGIPMLNINEFISELESKSLEEYNKKPIGKDYNRALIKNKKYILEEFKYVERILIGEKTIDKFKKELLKKNKSLHDIGYKTTIFTIKNQKINNPFKDLCNYLATFGNPPENF